MKNVTVVIGAGSIGQAMARRVRAGRHVLLADLRQQKADAAPQTLTDAGFEVSTANVDVSSRASVEALVAAATGIGEISGLIHAAGLSPTQASPATILSYRRMIDVSAAGRAGTPGEVGNVGALLTGHDGGFIPGSDFLMDGGVTAAYWFGELAAN